MRKQFDKKKQNSQELKQKDNMWLKTKNIQTKQPSKKLDQKRFNEDLLTWCRKLQFKGQHMKAAPPPDIINEEEEYEVEKVWNCRKQGHSIWFLVY